MAIIYDSEKKIFHLQAGDSSYIMQVSEHGFLYHVYYGKHVSDNDLSHLLVTGGGASFSSSPADAPGWSLDIVPMEYPGAGAGDHRVPAVSVMDQKGVSAVDLRYVSHEIQQGKPGLPGLPAVYLNDENEAETLAVTLKDQYNGLTVTVYYAVFAACNVLTRWVVLENAGDAPLQLQSAMSACIQLPGMDYDMLDLHGSWARERHIGRRSLAHGTQAVQSRRGSSSHQLNPFTAICSRDADEDHGDVYGMSLVYSGNFLIEAEVNQMDTTRVVMGINSFDFSWQLKPGESFTTPEAVLVYSNAGFGKMSRTYHKLYRKNLCRGEWRDKRRPILINNWEATYFQFDADKLVDIAKEAKKVGIEMLVMDDGWFGKRDADNSGLGDWVVNEEKLGCTLNELVKRIQDVGLQFGIWFEPEMISPDSDLYRAHPDWALHIPGRPGSLGRNQLVLNLAKKEVCDYLVDSLAAILESADIRYVKWDFNRNLTEVYDPALPTEQSREIWHRYVLGLYDVLERLNTRFPKILFESCSGGGGRYDPGMLYYMPQTWASDDTDAAERLKIQYGTSMVYPISSMGAHVSDVPNHQTNRTTPFLFRGDVALMGTFGYELDLTKIPEDDLDQIEDQVDKFKEYNTLIRTGDFYRLISPFEKDETAWMVVSEDKSEAFVQCFLVRNCANMPARIVKLKGLDPDMQYTSWDLGITASGDTLMNAGILVPSYWGDYQSVCIALEEA